MAEATGTTSRPGTRIVIQEIAAATGRGEGARTVPVCGLTFELSG